MKNVYFIGIGGIGMSALARYYKFKGYNVAGYDRTPSDLTFALEAEGIDVHYQDQPELLPEDKNETLVVYTPAIPADLGELVKAREEGYLLLKRSRTLGEVSWAASPATTAPISSCRRTPPLWRRPMNSTAPSSSCSRRLP